MEKAPCSIQIREIDPTSWREIELVANRMRETLIEVLGEARGSSFYTMEWLLDRVLWHLDPRNTDAKVFLSVDTGGRITGQAIVRIEKSEKEGDFGYFSTIYVEPAARKRGVATGLLLRVEEWLCEKRMPRIVYNTAETNERLIRLFGRHGYTITQRDKEAEMVQLTKQLGAPEKELALAAPAPPAIN